jgi:hypothetical protein
MRFALLVICRPSIPYLSGNAKRFGGKGKAQQKDHFPRRVGGSRDGQMPPHHRGKWCREEAENLKSGRKPMYGGKSRNFDGNNSRSGISSDDPKALEKLRAKLAEVENLQNVMKKVNAIIKREQTEERRIAALVGIGHEPVLAKRLLEPDYAGRIGFKEYQLTNNSANIRRIRERIAELERAATRRDTEEVTDAFIYREDTAENRLMFFFDGKPGEEIRALLKGRGFKWSPTRNAWVRQWTDNALYAARCVKSELTAMA